MSTNRRPTYRSHLGAALWLTALVVAAGHLAAVDAGAQGSEPFYQITGAASDAKLGAYVARVPDVDGDGADEIVAGSHRIDGPAGKDAGRVQLFSGKTGKLIWTVDGERADGLFGHNCWGIRDVDGDGRGDVIASAYRFDSTGRIDNGKVYLLSGKDGSVLWTAEGQNSADEFGYSLSDVPDLNNDGIDDVLVGAWNNDNSAYLAGRVYVYSGKDGAFIRAHGGLVTRDRLGSSVAGLRDLDGDGRGDYVLGARDGGASREGQVYFVSGRTGATYRTLTGQTANDQFGWNTTRLDDVDNDGFEDLFVGAPEFDLGLAVGSGRGYVLSGKTGAQLYTLDGEQAFDRFGRFAAAVPDTDGDGAGDVCVGAFNHAIASNGGAAYLYSGRAGTLVRKYSGAKRLSYFGFAICGLNDVNADGRGDVCVGAYQYMANPPANLPILESRGRIYVFVEETLTGSASSFSVSQGGSVTFSLDAGPTHAGRTYQLLCTVNGYLPGLNVASRMHLPLNPSDVFFLSFNIANSKIMQNSLRVFDQNGRGTATFNAGPALLAGQGTSGINLRFAYFMVVRLDHSSNMWKVALVP